MLSRVPDVVSSEIDGEVLLLPPGQQEVLHLNATASALWRALEQDAAEDDVVAGLAAAFDVDPAVVQRDLAPLVEQLVQQGVVRRC